jgi:hypothetical protein
VAVTGILIGERSARFGLLSYIHAVERTANQAKDATTQGISPFNWMVTA